MSQATTGSGNTGTVLSRGIFAGPFEVSREDEPNDWKIHLEGKADTRVTVQKIDFAPGGHSGWHKHPGPVFITVVSGTMTFYASDDPTCTPIVRNAGEGFLDGGGDDAHIARNETALPATNMVVYLTAAAGAPTGIRIDAPNPGNCPF